MRLAPALFAALLGLPACTAPNPALTTAENGPTALPPEAPFIEGELVVRFPAGTTRAEVEARVAPWGGVVLEAMSNGVSVSADGLGGGSGGDGTSDDAATTYLDGVVRLGLPEGMAVEEAQDLLATEGETLYAEPNYIVNAYRTPNDPRFAELWGMARIDAPGAWDHSTGSSNVVVAVIDTGLDYNHPELKDRAWHNPGEIAGNGIDDDGNGYVDDIYGWDFCNNDSDPMDDHGHGTHCSGTITGTGNNGVGVAGVSWNARVMGLKFLCANGSGNIYSASLAVRYAADNHATLTSNSWGGGGYSQALYDTILYAQTKNQLFVAAAGNAATNIDITNSYPAGYDLPNIISVAASDSGDGKASFSNYGATRVDLTAPGVGILSTLPNNSYAAWSGTSMATPHVSGALGLYYAANPTATWSAARDALFAAMDPLPAWHGVVATGGRLNVGRLMAGVAPPPATPVGVQAKADGPDGISVSWTPSTDPTVTGYLVYARMVGGQVRAAQAAATSPARVAPVSNGTWQLSVAAEGPGGVSGRSVEVPVTLVDTVPPGRILDLAVRGPAGAPVDVDRVVATSDFGDGWGAELAVDGDPLTGWAAHPEAAATEARLRCDVAPGTQLGRVTLAPLPGFEAFLPPGLEIRALVGGAWMVLASEAGAPPAGTSDWTWDFAPVVTDTVEIRVTELALHPSGLRYAVIGEIGLFAPPSDPSALELGFTAPGDDGAVGTAELYDVRIAPALTEAGFLNAPRYAVDPPAPPGMREDRLVTGLPSQTTLGVSVAAMDEQGQRGQPSPVVFATTGALPPGAPQELVAVTAGATSVDLTWRAPADDGQEAASGPVGAYEIRWSDREIAAADWPNARRFDGPVPVAPGAVQSFRLSGLPDSPRHHVRIAAVDRAGLRGPWSPEVAIDAPSGPDHVAPARVRDLTVVAEAAGAEPVALQVGPDAPELAPLIDGDVDTGWMQDGAPGATVSLAFSVGPNPKPLTRVVLLPHTLWPGDAPVAAALRTLDPQTGQWTERARVTSVAPGAPLVLGMAPVDTTEFTVDVTVGEARFGVAVVALGEVTAEKALPGGTRARLTWVAPGDDNYLGRAVEYDLRRAPTSMDTDDAFLAGTRVEISAPAEGGALEVATLADLGEASTVFFSLRARDDAGAWSPLGNSARLDVPPVSPGAVRDLHVVAVERTAVELAFTAPGDDGDVGRAATYDVRYVAGPMTPARFIAGTRVQVAAPGPAGTAERIRIEGLAPGTLYGFGLLAVDDAGTPGALGEPVSATTLEATPPAAVADLRVEAGASADRAVVRFTAPGDDGAVGRASSYTLRVFDVAPTVDTFAAGRLVATAAPQVAGSAEVAPVAGLAAERRFYFALTATDDAGNTSGLSNVATYDTPATPPAVVADLHVVDRQLNDLVVAFTAPGDDGNVGQATAYDLRWSRSPILSAADFQGATVAPTPAPQPAGRAESVHVGGLPEGTRIYLALVTRDDRGGVSPLSPSVFGDTLDRTAPARVRDLTGVAVVAAAALRPVDARSSSALMVATRADALTDENPESVWLSAPQDLPRPEWVLLDLGEPTYIDHIVLHPAPGYAAQFPASLRVDSYPAEPGVSGELILSEVGLTVAEGAALDRRFAPPAQPTRWLRLFIDATMPFGAQSLVALGDVEIFAADPGLRSVELAFTAPADVGPTGSVASYDIRVAADPFDPANFATGRTLGGPAAQAPGMPQRFTATGLAPETRFGFALVALDAEGNRSPVSNVAVVTTRGIPPSTIVDLRATAATESSLTVAFTAPSDAGAPAARYELRRSTTLLNADNFAQGTLVATGVPAAPGTTETVQIAGLSPSTPYWLAVRSADAGGDTSALSNVIGVRTQDPPERIPPAAVRDLRAATSPDADGAINLTFTAPGDDGSLGRATRYELRWSLAPLDTANFPQATPLAVLAPQVAGSIERILVGNLPSERTIHFAVRAIDDVGNVADLSNDASAPTRVVPPSTIADLRIDRDIQTAVLHFTAPGADRNVGRATRYEIFVSNTQFAAVVGMTPWAGAPAPQAAGTAETIRIPNRDPDSTTWAAVRAVDDAGNAGTLSPVVSVTFPDVSAPAAPGAVTLDTSVERGTLRLSFRSPGDDGFVGTAARYEVRWGEATFAPFDTGTPYLPYLGVVAGGTVADLILRSLPDERPIFVSVRAVDNAGTAGPASAVLSARTADVPPGRVADLHATAAGAAAIDLGWTATGDNALEGRAARYEVRRADAFITDATWAAATLVAAPPVPGVAGTPQTLRATGLNDGHVYFFALKVYDARGNVSNLSNVPSAATDDTTAPGAVADLHAQAEPDHPDTLRLRWTATGDDGAVGTAQHVLIRVFAGAWPGWVGATPIATNFVPAVSGTPQTTTIAGLDPETQYTVAIASVDEAGNTAAQSNRATAITGDVPPGAPRMVTAVPDGPGAIRLNWLAPADNALDAASGPVTRYEIALSTRAVTEFGSLPVLAGPAPVAPGGAQVHRLTGLADDTKFWILVRGVDAHGNVGAGSAVVTAATPDVAAPGRVITLVAQPPRTGADPVATGVAHASAVLSAAWPADAAFDGDPDSAWAAPPAADGQPPHVTVALDGRPRIGGLRLWVGDWPEQFPTSLELSLDGTSVATFDGLEPVAGHFIELSFAPRAAASLDLAIHAVGDPNGYVVLPEVEVLPADDPPDSLLLSWVAPGDDADVGTAARYDVRVSNTPINAANFAAARALVGPAPAAAGRPQSLRVDGLNENTTYHFALLAIDESGNRAAPSNDASAATGGVPPTLVSDLAATPDGPDAVVIQFTAPADPAGVARYDLRYRPGTLGDPSWDLATRVVTPAPGAAGTVQHVRITGLLPGTGYAFGLRATDGLGFTSRTSNLAYALTAPGPDVLAPSAVSDLRAHAVAGDGRALSVSRVSASGAQFPDLPPGAAADGDPTTAWATPVAAAAGEEWIAFTLPAPTTLDRLRVRAAADLADLFPSDFEVEASLDGQTFTSILSVSAYTADPARAGLFSFAPTPVTDVRIRAQRAHRADRFFVVMAEVELLEAAAPDAVTLTFVAPGDDGDVGTATAYRVGRAAAPLTEASWAAATIVNADLEPRPAGAPQAIVLTGLPRGRHSLAVRAVDEVGHLGAVGTSVVFTVP